MNKYKISN